MHSNIFDLTGKKALVVGGAGSIGYSIAEGLLEQGAHVVIADNSPQLSERTEVLKSRGYKCLSMKVDLLDREQIQTSILESREILGSEIDILVNSAGIQRRSSIEDFLDSDWDDVIAINLTAVFLYSKYVSQNMISIGRGKIINIASIMSQFGGRYIPAYAASKGGVAQLTKAMANDLGEKGICVNAIAPGYIQTPMNAALISDVKRNSEILMRTPVGRWGQPSDLKGIAIFLASDASNFLNGAIIPVDGGYSGR